MSLHKMSRWIILGIVAMMLAACGGCGGDEPSDETTATQGSGGSTESSDSGDDGGDDAAAAAGSSTIAGAVNFTGSAPEPEMISMDAEPTCMELHEEGPFAQNVLVNDDGMLANVFVYVKSGLEGSFPAPSEPVLLDQVGCRYIPHVLGVQTDQTIVIRNSDDVLHNIHPVPENSRGFNVGQPKKDMETEKSFSAAEIMIPVGCDVHGWMSAYIGVVDHPFFAVTGDDGSFELANLPAGDYVVEAWHEEFGTQEMNVSVGDGESATADFTFEGG